MSVVDAPHRFRFFVAGAGAPGALHALAPGDVRHVRVLRLVVGDVVEAVDANGAVWDARIASPEQVELVAALERPAEPELELVAGVLLGGRFDDLVDGAVQAGVTRIVPFAGSDRDAQRIEARRERLERLIGSAAKQAKRTTVPELAIPIDRAQLRAGVGGIVVDPTAPQQLVDVLPPSGPVRLLVGASEGLPASFVLELVGVGWQRGRLGPSILRSELAAPVAVAIAAMRLA